MKSHFYKCLSILIITITLVSCASGAVIITGKPREPIDPSAVTIYSEMPSNCEIIGLVTASSDSGLTAQGDINYAIIELKRQAANIGANGVVIENMRC